MLFTVSNNSYMSIEQLRTSTLLKAYYTIKKYPMHPTDLLIDGFLQQRYATTLKDMCIKLLLNLTFYSNKNGDLILLFKDNKYDKIASLITYGNGMIPGSKILQTALTA